MSLPTTLGNLETSFVCELLKPASEVSIWRTAPILTIRLGKREVGFCFNKLFLYDALPRKACIPPKLKYATIYVELIGKSRCLLRRILLYFRETESVHSQFAVGTTLKN